MSFDLSNCDEPPVRDLPEEEVVKEITEPLQEVAQETKGPLRQMRRDVLEPLRWLRIERRESAPRVSRRPVIRRSAGRSAPRTRRVRTAARGSPGGDDSPSHEDVDLRRAA